jgi:CRP-like cAMP-binding protein
MRFEAVCPVFKCTNSEPAAATLRQTSEAFLLADRLQPPLLKGLTKPEIATVLAAAVRRNRRRGAIVSTEGDAASEFFMLLSGRARYFTLTENGHRVILRWILPGEVFGAMALLHRPDAYLVSTELVRDSELLVWSRRDIRRLVVRYPRLMENVLAVNADYFRWYVTTHLALITRSAPQRLARVLFHLATDIGHTTQDGIELDVTNEELADAAYITRFSTSRLISKWQRLGILKKRRGKLFLTACERLFGNNGLGNNWQQRSAVQLS